MIDQILRYSSLTILLAVEDSYPITEMQGMKTATTRLISEKRNPASNNLLGH
jgi:hypothetical protein